MLLASVGQQSDQAKIRTDPDTAFGIAYDLLHLDGLIGVPRHLQGHTLQIYPSRCQPENSSRRANPQHTRAILKQSHKAIAGFTLADLIGGEKPAARTRTARRVE